MSEKMDKTRNKNLFLDERSVFESLKKKEGERDRECVCSG